MSNNFIDNKNLHYEPHRIYDIDFYDFYYQYLKFFNKKDDIKNLIKIYKVLYNLKEYNDKNSIYDLFILIKEDMEKLYHFLLNSNKTCHYPVCFFYKGCLTILTTIIDEKNVDLISNYSIYNSSYENKFNIYDYLNNLKIIDEKVIDDLCKSITFHISLHNNNYLQEYKKYELIQYNNKKLRQEKRKENLSKKRKEEELKKFFSFEEKLKMESISDQEKEIIKKYIKEYQNFTLNKNEKTN